MKIKISKLISLLLLVLSYNYLLLGQVRVIDRIVAIVGNEIILESELNQQVEFIALNNKMDTDAPGLKNQILDAMINEKLIVAKATEDTNIVVTEDEVTQQLDALIQQNIQQLGSEQKLEEIYGMPISRIRREFRDEMRKKLLAEKIKQFKFGTISVSRREVEEFFKTYRDSLPEVEEELELYHILKIPKKNPEVLNLVKKQAQLILDSIKSGGDFADFARRYSQDKHSAVGGGDLGFTRRGTFVREFEEAAYALEEGQISNLVESPFGIHIIQNIERRGENIHTRHILFKVESDESSDQQVIDFLNGIIDSVKNGGKFAEFAKKYSDDEESASIGGYLGFIPVSQLSENMLNVLQDMKEGEITQPIKVTTQSTSGYQIVYLSRRIPAHKLSLETDYKRIEIFASNYKRNIEYQKWLEEIREELYWEIKNE